VNNSVLVAQAAQNSLYSSSHIRYLIRKSLVSGQKVGGIWLVDRDDLSRYERQTTKQGMRKHTPYRYRRTDTTEQNKKG